MKDHLRILAILNLVMGCLAALGGLVVVILMGGAAHLIAATGAGDQDARFAAPLVATIGLGIGFFLLILAAPAIIGGWGLLNYRPWSRILMIILSVLHLFHIPLGTALGVYGLWVLFNEESRRILESGGLYQPLAGVRPPVMSPPQPTYPTQPPPAI